MNYFTGEIVEIGDSVALEYGNTHGTVHSVIESPQQIEEWGLDEPGIMVESEPLGWFSGQPPKPTTPLPS